MNPNLVFPSTLEELELLRDADLRANAYIASLSERRVFPDAAALDRLDLLDNPLPEEGHSRIEGLRLLDEVGSPATVVSNGPNYFGFVVGAALPEAIAAERLMSAWDQNAGLPLGSPIAARLEQIAAQWILEILDLPRGSAVGFGTSATACTISCLAAARRAILGREGWNFDANGLNGAPEIYLIISEAAHITVKKAIRLLGFGMKRITIVPVDALGRMDLTRLPPLTSRSILCLQAGEVNTGEFDTFSDVLPLANAAGAWVHVDGAFGLWARTSSRRGLTEGIELADSWTVDAHKWLNTPYDCAMAICKRPEDLASAMNSDAAYSTASADAQKNLTLEFSRRARGIPVWAVLRSLGRRGVAAMVEQHCAFAMRIADGLRNAGYEVLNRVVLNQVLVRGNNDDETRTVIARAQASGLVWFGSTVWDGRPAFRISVSSWRTEEQHVDQLLQLLVRLKGPPRL